MSGRSHLHRCVLPGYKKAKLESKMIPWMSSRPRIHSTAGLPIADEPADAGVDYDLRITLFGSPSRGA
jgi:hypothetical protein